MVIDYGAKIDSNFEITKYKCKFICLFNIIYDIIMGLCGCVAPPGLGKEGYCVFPQVPLTLHMRLRRSLRDVVSRLRRGFPQLKLGIVGDNCIR